MKSYELIFHFLFIYDILFLKHIDYFEIFFQAIILSKSQGGSFEVNVPFQYDRYCKGEKLNLGVM